MNLPTNSLIVGPFGPMSVEPSLVLVCDSKTGSCTRTDDGGVDRLADVGGVVVLLEMIAHRLDQRLAKCGEVRAAHRGVLAVDEGPILLAVMIAVGERDLDVLALEVDDRVERLAAELLGRGDPSGRSRTERLAVEREREPAIEEGVVPQHVLDELRAELEILAEERLVGRELDDACRCARRSSVTRDWLLELALLELDDLRLALADGLGAVVERRAR